VVARICKASWEIAFSSLCACPLCGSRGSGGRGGKKSTPGIRWEVLVKSSRLASEELDGAQAWENIFEFSSSVTVFHKVLIVLDSISILECIFYICCQKL